MTPLVVFKGEEISGTWTFRKDNKVGDGKNFSGFSFEFCSKNKPNPPTIET